MKSPRIIGILAAGIMLYGVWRIAPAWLTGALGLLVLYALLTNVNRATALVDQADAGLRALIRPPAAAGHSVGGTW